MRQVITRHAVTPGLSLGLIGNASGRTLSQRNGTRSEAFSISRLATNHQLGSHIDPNCSGSKLQVAGISASGLGFDWTLISITY
jgi:hypothetical protein